MDEPIGSKVGIPASICINGERQEIQSTVNRQDDAAKAAGREKSLCVGLGYFRFKL